MNTLSSCPTGWRQQIWKSGGPRESFKEVQEIQTIFLIILVFILSQRIKICTDWAREMVGKAAGTSAWTMTLASSYSHYFPCTHRKKKKVGGGDKLQLTKSLNSKNFITPLPLSIHLFNILLCWNEKCWLYSMLKCEACVLN